MTYDSAATIVVAGGLIAGLLAGGTAGYRAGVAVALELWMAAALLRLAGTPTWSRLATAATVIVIRTAARHGLVNPPPMPALRTAMPALRRSLVGRPRAR